MTINTDIFNDFYYYYQTERQEVKDAGFLVLEYDMKFKIREQLYAEVTLTPDKNDLTKYIFTLYHRFAVKDVTDQDGTRLRFTQKDDYVDIETNAQRYITQINITYSGYHLKFYSNYQGICLPQFTVFYPQSRHRIIYNEARQGYYKNALDNKPSFTVTVDYPKKVYTNFDEGDNRVFRGSSNALTLISGFLDSTSVKGTEFIYPYLHKAGKDSDRKEMFAKGAESIYDASG